MWDSVKHTFKVALTKGKSTHLYIYIRKAKKLSHSHFVHHLLLRYSRWQLRLKLKIKIHQSLFYTFSTIGAVILCGGLAVVLYQFFSPNYQLTRADIKLIGSADTTLMKKGKFLYDSKSQTYYLNKSDLKSSSSNVNQNAVSFGNTSATASYALKLSANLNRGVTVRDNKSGLSLSLNPQFSTSVGKNISSHIVYPLTNTAGADAVYTVKQNGLQEDIILNHPTNQLKLTYKLSLPNYLVARNLSRGAVGIYSADPALFGNINYGSNADRQKVAEARVNGQKNYLVFVLLPSVIRNTQTNAINPNGSTTSLSLKNNTLTLVASHLSKAAFPLDIDPSILVNSATAWGPSGNNEGDVTIASNQINEAGLTGAALASWTASSVSLPVALSGSTAVVNNGYLYVIGGYNNSATVVQTVEYAPIGSSGALNTQTCPAGLGWTLTSSTWCVNTSSLQTGVSNATSVVYNGYIYEIGGVNNAGTVIKTVEFAQVAADGSLAVQSACPTGWTLGGSNNTWCYNSTNLDSATEWAASSVYNGYIYEIGGINNSSSLLRWVEFAQVAADGSLAVQSACPTGWTLGGSNSNWCFKTTELASATACLNSDAYNGYMYVIGGSTQACAGVISTTASTSVFYAPINADGSIGTLTSTSSLSGATQNASTVVNNGYIYEIGGCSSNDCGTILSTVEYASINSDGTLGAWSTTTALPSSRFSITSISYNNYVYSIGGQTNASSGNNLTTINYAQIQSAGYLAPDNTESVNLPNSMYDSATTTYNGYIYILGGYDGSAAKKYTEYAQVGNTGLQTQTCHTGYTLFTGNVWCYDATNLTLSGRYQNAVAYNGFVYLFDGRQGGNVIATVNDAPINSDGSLGTWGTTTSINTAAEYATAAVYNGYIYSFSGYDGTSSITTVQYAPINANGTLGTWVTSSFSIHIATQYASTVVNNGYVYILGGCTASCGNGTGNGSTYMEFAKIGTSGDLTTQIGNTCPSGWTIDSNHVWCYDSTELPNASAWASAVVDNSYVYLIGGCSTACTGTPVTTIEYAPLNSDGSVGSWATNASLTSPYDQATAVALDGSIYELGGFTGATASFIVDDFLINNGGQGTIGSWASTTSFSTSAPTMPARDGFGAVAYNGYLYVMGGRGPSATGDCAGTVAFLCNGTFYAPLNNDGTLGSWTATTTFPASSPTMVARSDFGAVAYNGYLYVMGGEAISSSGDCTATGDYCNGTFYAPINANGTIGSWTATTTFPASSPAMPARVDFGAVAYNGYLYVMGGFANTANAGDCLTANANYCNGTFYAPINANGTIGSWAATTTFPASSPAMPTREAFGSVAYNGYLYVMGGVSSASSGDCTATGDYCNGTFYAPINANGTIGSWAATTNFGISMVSRAFLDSVADNGYLYVMDGLSGASGGDCTAAGDQCNGTFYAPINANGTIGSWAATTTFPASSPNMPARSGASAVDYNGYLYVMGGRAGASASDCTAAGDRCKGVFVTGLQSTPRVGYFSELINMANSATNPNGNVDPIEIVSNGSNTGNPGIGGISGPGGIIIDPAMADNTCTTFSTPNSVNTGISNQLANAFNLVMTTNGCGTATNLASYLWIRFTLDDSQTTSFPDINGNQTTISNFTVYYQPNPTYRLRGGSTFNNGSLQTLSTPP